MRISDDWQNACHIPVPWWLWFVPILLVSAFLTKAAAPSLCSERCLRSYTAAHPKAWFRAFLISHGVVLLFLIWAIAEGGK